MITATLGRLSAGENLTQQEMANTIDLVMDGQVTDEQIALLLTALHVKGETADELAGAAASLRKHMTPIRTRHAAVIDTCGTGGSGSKLFNISTTAALVTAAAGVPVAKHGNRAITSRTGSADVLSVLGVNIAADVPLVEKCLDELGICFCFAPLLHPTMKRVAEVRRQLGIPTIFNLLGPLCNPAGAPFQLLGVGRTELCKTIAEALPRLGTQHSAIVNGGAGIGEVTIAGPTQVFEVSTGGLIKELRWTPTDFGISTAKSLEPVFVNNVEGSADLIRRVLAGEGGPARDMVVANAAAALWVVGKTDSLSTASDLAQQAIDSGEAKALLERLIDLTNQYQ